MNALSQTMQSLGNLPDDLELDHSSEFLVNTAPFEYILPSAKLSSNQGGFSEQNINFLSFL